MESATNPKERGRDDVFRHLVISGAGAGGVILYGALRTLCADGLIDMKLIDSIDAVSAGALIAVILLLGYELDYLDDYVVRRPWNRTFSTADIDPVNVLLKKGIFDASMVVEIVRPLLEARDVSPDITLQDFQKYTNTRIFMYTVDLNSYPLKTVQLSSQSHPDLSLSLALQMTCCYPIIFGPVIHGAGCYVDGGITTKCPTTQCINRLREEAPDDDAVNAALARADEDVIVVTCESSPEYDKVGASTSMIEYVRHIVNQMNHAIVATNDHAEVKHTVRCFNSDTNTFNAWYKCIHSEEKRHEYVQAGARFARIYAKSIGKRGKADLI